MGHGEHGNKHPFITDELEPLLGNYPRTPPRENDTRGYGGVGVHQIAVDLCHAWQDGNNPIAANSRAAMRSSLAEQFKGVTTDGTVVPGLYPLENTGLSTKKLKYAAEALLDTLQPEMRAAISFPVGADEWRTWHNGNEWANRHGAFLGDMNEHERNAFEALLRASLSDSGFELIRDAMRLNEFLGEIVQDVEVLNEWTYWLTIFGRPSLDEPWGWQLDGHHINLNVFVLQGQVVMTPLFVGAEPRICDAGKFAGTSVLLDFDEPAVTLMEALSDQQRTEATLSRSIRSKDLPRELTGPNGRHRGGALSDNLVLPYEGTCASSFDQHQKRLLLDVCDLWIKRLPPGHDRLKMNEIERHIDQAHFCWIGGYTREDPFYFKVHSPVVMLEYDNHAGLFMGDPEPVKSHTHTVMRTPNGNDYGKDLLRQHYARHHRS